MLNFAIGFSILLSAMISLFFNPLSHLLTAAAFCSFVAFLYFLLRLTAIEQILAPTKLISYIFGFANIMVFIGLALFSLGTGAGANGIGAAMFVGLFFFIPAIALLLIGSIVVTVKLFRKTVLNPKHEFN